MAKKATQILAVSFLLVFILLLTTSSFTVQAKSTKTTYTCMMHLGVSAPEPEKQWFSNDIWHIRNWPHAGYLYDGLDWTIFYLGNNNFNQYTFVGVGWGKIIFYADDGTFEGTMVINFDTGFAISGKFICHGTGAYEGMHIKGYFEGYLGSDTATTIVLHNPHGNGNVIEFI
ncbi:MAG: hypothetical protein ACFFD8_05315 [Candidatus Thorarchaeota archaeon]